MIPKRKALLLAEDLSLYSNLAMINEVTGRLNVKLQIHPSSFIEWHFEFFLDDSLDIRQLRESLKDQSFTAPILSVERLTQNQETYTSFGNLCSFAGHSTKLVLGDKHSQAQSFYFLLTNTKFLSHCLAQDMLKYKVYEKGLITQDLPEREISTGEEGKFIDVSLNSTWKLRLEIRKDATDWLEDKHRSIGNYLTCEAELYQPARSYSDNWNSLELINLDQAESKIQDIAWLLSYVNCGFTAPLYIEAKSYRESPTDTPSYITNFISITTDLQSTSLEMLGQSWLIEISNLKSYLGCFSAFQKMLLSSNWKDTYYFVLIQYFQATRLGDWQLAASATGAALERLSYQILVEEESDPNTKTNHELLFNIRDRNQAKRVWNLGRRAGQQDVTVTAKRLMLTLERIGLTAVRGHNDTDDVPTFLDVRNDAVHPRVGTMDINERFAIILKAIQWIDEILLWRLGYDGKYLDRIAQGERLKGTIGTHSLASSARYDLTLRDSRW